MKPKWKIAAAVVGALILLVAAIPLFVNINTFKPVIEGQLSTMLGRQVKLGDLSLSVLSGIVDAHNLTVADDPNFSTEPFITATDFHIDVKIRPLIFDRQIIIDGLEINSPQIHLVHATSGAWNFSTIGQGAAKPTPTHHHSGRRRHDEESRTGDHRQDHRAVWR